MDLDAIPGLLADPDFPVVVALRHEPDEASGRLLESLGASWTIDEDAPPCVRACGQPECRRRTAAELRRIAELVDAETRRRDLPRIRERVERGIERGMRVVREPLVRYGTPPVNGSASAPAKKCRTEGCENDASSFAAARGPYAGLCEQACIPAKRLYLQETNGGAAATPDEERPVDPDRGCRTVGCENRANARYTRGPLSGLCWEACIPKQKLHLSEVAKRRGGESAHRTIETPGPEGVPGEPPGGSREGVPGREPSLAELAADLERAHLIFEDAEAEYEHAVERFLAHPLVRRLDVGYPES